MTTRPPARCLLAAAATLAAGCAVGPNYESPRVTVLNEFGEQGREPTTRPANSILAVQQQPSRTISGRAPVVAWWTTFRDPMLDDLIVRAADNNTDVRQATARLRQARGQRNVVRADLLPTLNAAGSYEYVRPSTNGVASAFGGSGGSGSSGSGSTGSSGSGSTGSTGGGGAGGGGSATGGTAGGANVGGTGSSAAGAGGTSATPGAGIGEFNLYQIGFDATYEVDLFGAVFRSIEGADADVQAAVEYRRDVLLSLLGEIANNYVSLRAAQRRLQIARDNLAAQQRTTNLIAEQARQGLSNEFDLTRAQAQALTTQATIPSLEAQIGQLIHALSILIAERPTALASMLETMRPVPPIPDEVPIGLPSELLRRRPDIRRAERQLASQTANIGLQIANALPRFSLNGSAGLQTVEPARHLVDYASRYFSVGPSFTWPVFDAGRNKARIRIAEAQRDEAMAAFQGVVLGAMRDVEDALLTYDRTQVRVRVLGEAVVANRKALRIANDLYNQGLTDFLNVLDAERSLFAAEDSLATSEGDRAIALVTLYKALGGGWEIQEQPNVYGPALVQPVVDTRQGS